MVKGPPGIGFKLTSNGDYDIVNKCLNNVKGAVSGGDALTRIPSRGTKGGLHSLINFKIHPCIACCSFVFAVCSILYSTTYVY